MTYCYSFGDNVPYAHALEILGSLHVEWLRQDVSRIKDKKNGAWFANDGKSYASYCSVAREWKVTA